MNVSQRHSMKLIYFKDMCMCVTPHIHIASSCFARDLRGYRGNRSPTCHHVKLRVETSFQLLSQCFLNNLLKCIKMTKNISPLYPVHRTPLKPPPPPFPLSYTVTAAQTPQATYSPVVMECVLFRLTAKLFPLAWAGLWGTLQGSVWLSVCFYRVVNYSLETPERVRLAFLRGAVSISYCLAEQT